MFVKMAFKMTDNEYELKYIHVCSLNDGQNC